MSTGTRPSSPDLPPRVPRALIAASAAAVVACAAWAAWPVAPRPVDLPALDEPQAPVAAARLAALDLDPFRAPVWVAPPAPAPEPEPAKSTPPPPLKLQLLAITREGERYRAVLYDPETDRLHVVAAGESVGGRTVDSVDAGAIALRDGSGVRTLALNDDRPGEGQR